MTLMSQELVMFFASLIVVTITTVIMFLPTIIELRKPQDAGPRLITAPASGDNSQNNEIEDEKQPM